MKRKKAVGLVVVLSLIGVFIAIMGAAGAEDQPAPSLPAAAGEDVPFPFNDPAASAGLPKLERTAPGVYKLDAITIDTTRGTVEFPAVVNMNEGLIEYLVVERFGNTHESLVWTLVDAYTLNVALTLLGLKGTDNPLAQQGDPRAPSGQPVTLTVKWQVEGAEKTARIEHWVLNKQSNQAMQETHWVYTGSFVRDGVFMARTTKSIAAIFRDPAALIDNPLPDGSNDEIWFANTQAMPSVGTGVTVVISKLTEQK